MVQNHGYVDVEIKEVRKERVNGRMTLVIVVSEGIKYMSVSCVRRIQIDN